MWDVFSAKQAGYRGAYCTILEKESCADIFGEMDVMADTLPDMARKIIEASKAQVSKMGNKELRGSRRWIGQPSMLSFGVRKFMAVDQSRLDMLYGLTP